MLDLELPQNKTHPPIALALGGGGARGIAHIIVLEALDEMGIKPIAIAGSSMGAIIACLYSSGMTGKDIRDYFIETTNSKTHVLNRLLMARVGKFTDIFTKGLSANPILIDAEKFLSVFMPSHVPSKIEELEIPVSVVATDFYARESVSFSTGALIPAIAASMAIPGLINPVIVHGRVLIDGGALNPLPVKNVMGRNRLIIAVDVTDTAIDEERQASIIPTPMQALYGSVSAMMEELTHIQLQNTPPDMLVTPPVGRFSALDFFKTREILEACAGTKSQMKRNLNTLLETFESKRKF